MRSLEHLRMFPEHFGHYLEISNVPFLDNFSGKYLSCSYFHWRKRRCPEFHRSFRRKTLLSNRTTNPEVREVNNNTDAPAFVLTQTVMDKAKNNQDLLPVSLLRLVIRFRENLLHEIFDKYLEKTTENYLEYRKLMDDQVNTYLNMGMSFSSLTEKNSRRLKSCTFLRRCLSSTAERNKSV